MIGIVEDLRRTATCTSHHEAAAEIERLSKEVDGLTDNNLAIWAAHNRLRDALREIAVMETGRANATVRRMAQKARDALGDGT
jgi:HAMP domain-containing protein